MKKLILSAMVGTSMAFILTACVSPKTRQLERHNQALYPTIKAEINPNPTQKYDVIIDATNSIDGLALSELSIEFTSKCRLFLRRIPATVTISEPLYHKMPVAFQQIGKQKYQATIYKDWLIDKDYFNHGQNCGWQTPSIRFAFTPNPNPYALELSDSTDIGRHHETRELLADNEPYQGTFYFNRLKITNPRISNIHNKYWAELSSTDKWYIDEVRPHLGKIYITATPNFNKSDMNKKP
ncbi:hypothetical protein [Moraxella oblonga]|uniref:hypothetical protein n=1 Tax=Moraxella oblonga TaxID=200413 RepID=UPI00082DB69C|nr:hypothetical protein [Moraxella oblonga]